MCPFAVRASRAILVATRPALRADAAKGNDERGRIESTNRTARRSRGRVERRRSQGEKKTSRVCD